MIKLSECGYPRRYLWVTLGHILSSLKQLVDNLASHQTILAPCSKCKRNERFEGTLRIEEDVREYQCVGCGDYIKVQMDVSWKF